MIRNESSWFTQYEILNALWAHEGSPEQPHALLASGNHSNGFFNSRFVIPQERLLRDAASDLLEIFAQKGGDISKVQAVVGPQTGATKLAEFISDQISTFTKNYCFWASPAKSEDAGKKSMVFNEEDRSFLPGQSCLLCEDVLTTGRSVLLAEKAILDIGGSTLPYILVLVNRSGLKEVEGKKIIALINRYLPIWTPEECPLCKEGSKAIPPKGENWELLKSKY